MDEIAGQGAAWGVGRGVGKPVMQEAQHLDRESPEGRGRRLMREGDRKIEGH